MNIQINNFHRLSIGQKFQTHLGGEVFTKTRKGGTEFDNGNPYNIGPQKLVILVKDQSIINREDKDLIDLIVSRASRDYNGRIDPYRLTDGLIAAHLTKPIRLNDLLHTCYNDFYMDIVLGVYRHYDPKTGTIKDGWTAQHSEPKKYFWE